MTPLMPLTIRPATRRDIPALLPMVQALAAHHADSPTVTADTLTRDITGPVPWFRILMAVQDKTPAGYAALTRIGRLQFGQRGMDLHHLFVRPERRGHGIGTALIKASMTQARQDDCAYLVVGTADGNTDAQRLYLHHGFTPVLPGGTRFRLDLPVDDRPGRP
jgi:GNAT superfamily N-acetyltransferase